MSHGAGIESVDVVAVDVAAAAGRDSVAIRYENWKFVSADYAIGDGSEGSDYCEKLETSLPA